MKDYFNLTIEEKKTLADKHDFRPDKFAKPVVVEETVEETTTETTTVADE